MYGYIEIHDIYHILNVIFLIHIWTRNFILQFQRHVSYLNGQTVFEIEQTGLTYVLQSTADLTNFCFFETHFGTRTPAEDSKWSKTNLTFLAISFFSLKLKKKLVMHNNDGGNNAKCGIVTIRMYGLSPKQVWHKTGNSCKIELQWATGIRIEENKEKYYGTYSIFPLLSVIRVSSFWGRHFDKRRK